MIKFLTLWQIIWPAITLRPLLWEPLFFFHVMNTVITWRITSELFWVFFPTATVKCQTADIFFFKSIKWQIKKPDTFSFSHVLVIPPKKNQWHTDYRPVTSVVTDQWDALFYSLLLYIQYWCKSFYEDMIQQVGAKFAF